MDLDAKKKVVAHTLEAGGVSGTSLAREAQTPTCWMKFQIMVENIRWNLEKFKEQVLTIWRTIYYHGMWSKVECG